MFLVRYCLKCAGDCLVRRDNSCTGVHPDNAPLLRAARKKKRRKRTPMRKTSDPRAKALIRLFKRGRDDLADLPIKKIYKVVDKHVGKQGRELAQNLRKSTRRARRSLGMVEPKSRRQA